jgi:type I site-specific restriction endonuclease
VCGKTHREKRRQVLADFAAGKVQVVCNCGVLTEGFDDPGVEVVIMGRPTKSRSLYSQMVGRSTRPLPGVVDGPETEEARRAAIAASTKPSCLVVDFVGNAGKHKLVTSADILGGKVSEEAVELAVGRARKAGGPVNMTEALDEAEEELKEQKRLAETARRARLVATARFSTQAVDPFDVLHLEPVKQRGWDVGRGLTEKQRALLAKQGINPDGVSFSQGRQLIAEIFRRWDGKLCSFKQAKVLRKYGYNTEVSFAEASATIDALAKNGWRKPVAAQGEPALN